MLISECGDVAQLNMISNKPMCISLRQPKALVVLLVRSEMCIKGFDEKNIFIHYYHCFHAAMY